MKIFVLALVLMLYAVPIQAQQDTVLVEVIDRTDLNVLIEPAGPVKMFRGDSLQFTATAVDTVSGDTLNVEFVWSSSNENVVQIDASTGMARFLSRGNAEITVEVLRIIATFTAGQADDGTWFLFENTYSIAQNEWRPMCFYHEYNDGRVASSASVNWQISSSDPNPGAVPQLSDTEGNLGWVGEFTGAVPATGSLDCPTYDALLPLLPMPQQIQLMLRQGARVG